jgi:hypothetical protein
MLDESSLPHRGDEINGYRASLSTGLEPRLLRYLLQDTHFRSAYILLLIGTPIGLALIWLGSRMLGSHSVKTLLVAVILCGAGGLTAFLSPIIAAGMAWSGWKWRRTFRHGLLIPGVVVSKDPLTLVGLADLGKSHESKGQEFGLARAQLWSLPNHPNEVGTRVPSIANFNEEGRDRFFYFSPYPVSHGTGDAFDLEQCVQKLGEASFRRIEGLIARDLTPEHWNRMVVVNANDEVIETRGYMEAGEMTSADRKKYASQQ